MHTRLLKKQGVFWEGGVWVKWLNVRIPPEVKYASEREQHKGRRGLSLYLIKRVYARARQVMPEENDQSKGLGVLYVIYNPVRCGWPVYFTREPDSQLLLVTRHLHGPPIRSPCPDLEGIAFPKKEHRRHRANHHKADGKHQQEHRDTCMQVANAHPATS